MYEKYLFPVKALLTIVFMQLIVSKSIPPLRGITLFNVFTKL